MTRFRFQLKGGYVIGLLTIPTEVGAVQVATLGGTKADALMRAATIAQRISEDPVMAALMPPQAAAAISAAKALSAAARKGPKSLKRLWGKIRGPGKKRLAEALAREASEKAAGVGAMYWGKHSDVKQPNRGAWEEWLDYDHENIDPDADDDGEYELGRKRRKRRRRTRARDRAQDDAPLDEPAAPTDEPAYEDEGEPERADNDGGDQ